jgi:hypothetical protein
VLQARGSPCRRCRSPAGPDTGSPGPPRLLSSRQANNAQRLGVFWT